MIFRLFSINELDQIGNTLFETRNGWKTLDQVKTWLDIGEIVQLFGTWAVTDYGVECLIEYYPIEKARLTHSWIEHMSEKSWMTAASIRDLATALDYAKEHFNIIKPRASIDLRTRFAILKRDNYRCQMCGRKASDTLTLEIDHRVALSKGGSNHKSNLWALCYDCNRGKSASDL